MIHSCFEWGPSSWKLDGSYKRNQEASSHIREDVPLVQFPETYATKPISKSEVLVDASF